MEKVTALILHTPPEYLRNDYLDEAESKRKAKHWLRWKKEKKSTKAATEVVEIGDNEKLDAFYQWTGHYKLIIPKPAEVNFLRLGSAPWVAALEIKLSKFGVSTLPIPIGHCSEDQIEGKESQV